MAWKKHRFFCARTEEPVGFELGQVSCAECVCVLLGEVLELQVEFLGKAREGGKKLLLLRGPRFVQPSFSSFMDLPLRFT